MVFASAVVPRLKLEISSYYFNTQDSAIVHHQHLLQKNLIMSYLTCTAMTRRCETDVLAHRHQEDIFDDEEEVNTQRDALLCGYKFTWQRHEVRRFPNLLLSRVVSLHFYD